MRLCNNFAVNRKTPLENRKAPSENQKASSENRKFFPKMQEASSCTVQIRLQIFQSLFRHSVSAFRSSRAALWSKSPCWRWFCKRVPFIKTCTLGNVSVNTYYMQ